eukprot:GHVL01009634.1.p1 GENE.GHVL01009634.1~~GHVL01009634.1.p1  ORF type:complete len:199 (-),score=24.91 GHVL01009634.1:271-867(-)
MFKQTVESNDQGVVIFQCPLTQSNVNPFSEVGWKKIYAEFQRAKELLSQGSSLDDICLAAESSPLSKGNRKPDIRLEYNEKLISRSFVSNTNHIPINNDLQSANDTSLNQENFPPASIASRAPPPPPYIASSAPPPSPNVATYAPRMNVHVMAAYHQTTTLISTPRSLADPQPPYTTSTKELKWIFKKKIRSPIKAQS